MKDFSDCWDRTPTSRKANPIDVHVGARLRARRMLLGVTQEEMGVKLDLTFQGYQKWESGETRIGASRLFQLSKILEVTSVDYFFEGLCTGAPQSTSQQWGGEELPRTYLETRACLDLNKAFLNVRSPETRRHILRLVKGLSETGTKPGEQETSVAEGAGSLKDA